MIVLIPEILTRQELVDIRANIKILPFVDGTETAGPRAKRVKRNEQVSQKSADRKNIQNILVDALRRNKDFTKKIQPKHIRPPLISRYRKGMAYGKHVDDALMGPASARERSDVSVTIFLSDVRDYEGGELVIHSSFGPQHVKLPAGSAVAYPSSSIHEVTEVTKGERLVAVTWVQSYIRNDWQRDLLADLSLVQEYLTHNAPEAPETDIAFRIYANLLRQWSE